MNIEVFPDNLECGNIELDDDRDDVDDDPLKIDISELTEALSNCQDFHIHHLENFIDKNYVSEQIKNESDDNEMIKVPDFIKIMLKNLKPDAAVKQKSHLKFNENYDEVENKLEPYEEWLNERKEMEKICNQFISYGLEEATFVEEKIVNASILKNYTIETNPPVLTISAETNDDIFRKNIEETQRKLYEESVAGDSYSEFKYGKNENNEKPQRDQKYKQRLNFKKQQQKKIDRQKNNKDKNKFKQIKDDSSDDEMAALTANLNETLKSITLNIPKKKK